MTDQPQPLCGLPHRDHPESLCTEPAGHQGPHAAVLVIDGTERGALAWDAEPDTDTCHPVNIGGETIRVRGTREMTDQERGYLTEIVNAARIRYATEHPDEPDVEGPRRA